MRTELTESELMKLEAAEESRYEDKMDDAEKAMASRFEAETEARYENMWDKEPMSKKHKLD